MKIVFVILISGFLLACASQRPKNAANYETGLVYPAEEFPYVFIKKHIFDDPLAGVSLTYVDEKSPSDFITVYVYPIPDVSWEEKQPLLNSEMDVVLSEVDYMVEMGRYESRSGDQRDLLAIPANGENIEGLESVFNYVYKGVEYSSFAYLFLEEDKFIKFRVSFISNENPDWDGRHIVQTILPKIDVPPESEYMKKLRAEAKQKMMMQIIQSIINEQNDDSEDVE